MMGKGVRLSPKPSLQEAPEIEGGILEEMDQTTTLNQIIEPMVWPVCSHTGNAGLRGSS